MTALADSPVERDIHDVGTSQQREIPPRVSRPAEISGTASRSAAHSLLAVPIGQLLPTTNEQARRATKSASTSPRKRPPAATGGTGAVPHLVEGIARALVISARNIEKLVLTTRPRESEYLILKSSLVDKGHQRSITIPMRQMERSEESGPRKAVGTRGAIDGRRRSSIAFLKCHSLGNDFVIVDGRKRFVSFTMAEAIALTDRHCGIGADQLLTLIPSARADIGVRIHNVDGREAAMCGNALRCIGALIMSETGQSEATVEVSGVLLVVRRDRVGLFGVNLGVPVRDWRKIPLAYECDPRTLPMAREPLLEAAGGVGFGNPHAVFIVRDFAPLPLGQLGSMFEQDPLFPDGTNVSFARVDAVDRLRLKTWERSVGFTRACSSGAAAALVVAHERGCVGEAVTVEADGGLLSVAFDAAGDIWVTGSVANVFSGIIDPHFWSQL